MKSKKKVLLFISLILTITILFFRFNFGIKSEFTVINLLVLIGLICLIIFNIINIFKLKNRLLNILHLILTICIIVIIFKYIVFLGVEHLFLGKNIVINEYKISNSEVLKNVRFSEGPKDTETALIYERKLFPGIKCSMELKINLDDDKLYDLKNEWIKLKKKKNAGFCKWKIKNEIS